MDKVSARALQLKALRERAGYGLREFARLLDRSASNYQHYEAGYKKAYLPSDFVEKISPLLLGKGQPPITLTELVSLYEPAPMTELQSTQGRDATEVQEALDAPSPITIRSQMPRDVPVLGTATGGSDADFSIMNGDAVDFVRRPPRLMGRKDIFALWVRSDSMSPWRFPGDLIYCEGIREADAGDFVVIEMKPTDRNTDLRPVYIKRLVARSTTLLTVEQYNPRKQFTIQRADVHQLHRVMDWSELLGV